MFCCNETNIKKQEKQFQATNSYIEHTETLESFTL